MCKILRFGTLGHNSVDFTHLVKRDQSDESRSKMKLKSLHTQNLFLYFCSLSIPYWTFDRSSCIVFKIINFFALPCVIIISFIYKCLMINYHFCYSVHFLCVICTIRFYVIPYSAARIHVINVSFLSYYSNFPQGNCLRYPDTLFALPTTCRESWIG